MLDKIKMKNHNLLLSAEHLFFLLLLILQFQFKDLKAQFAYGADISWLSQMEKSGRIFNDNSGNQKDCLQILKEKGINALRFRVWVNPTEDFNNKKDVVYMALRAKSKGFDVMIDFHMSDSWADPGKQTKPAAWVGHSFSQLQTDVYNHVYSVLDTLKSSGVIPKWVQIGNETNDGMLWPDGKASTSMSNFAALINSGYTAVKAIDNSIQVIVQLSDGHENSKYRWLFDGLKYNGAKWDIIGMSVYPSWAGLPWATDNSMSLVNMQDMISRYNTKVMVCEAGYSYNLAADAKNYLADLISKTKSAGGLGVFYWEPECYNWQNYSLGAWDPVTKQPTIAMDAFQEANPNPLSVKEENILANYELNIYPNPFNPSAVINWQLAVSGNITLKIFDMLGREVATLVDEFQTAGKHSINLNAQQTTNNQKLTSGVYLCRMIAGKYVVTKKIVLMK